MANCESKVEILHPGGFWADYLLGSVNEWERLAGEVGVTFSSGAEQAELLRASVRGAGTHAALENTEAIAHLSLTAPEYRVGGCRLGQGYTRPCAGAAPARVPHQQGADPVSLSRLDPR